MMANMVDIGEAKTRLPELVSLALKGDAVIISEHNKPLAKIVPVYVSLRPRIPGLNRGKIWISEDFDDPIPDEFWTGEA